MNIVVNPVPVDTFNLILTVVTFIYFNRLVTLLKRDPGTYSSKFDWKVFWSVFFCTRTEYGMQDQKNPYLDTFHAVQPDMNVLLKQKFFVDLYRKLKTR